MAILNPITIEAETLSLSANYERESDDRIREGLTPVFLPFASGNDLIRLKRTTTQGSTGTASGNFSSGNGETGLYTITANIFEESDGVSTGSLQIGSNPLLAFSYNQDLRENGITAANRRSVTFNNVQVNANDGIVFTGSRQGNEVARLDSLVFTPIFTGALEFSSSSFNVAEDSGTATVTIVRTGGMTGQMTATLNVNNGTADTADYSVAAQSTVVFAQGQTTATVLISITDDALAEGNETVALSLSPIDGSSLVGTQANANLLIIDNDGAIPQDPTPQDPTPVNPTVQETPSFFDGDDTVTGTDGVDIFDAQAGNDLIRAGAGDDQVSGGDGDDTLLGEAGDDELRGDGGNDSLNGGPGLDTLIGGGGADTLRGNGGADNLNGSGGRDRLFGNGGNDTLNGGGGRDRLNGGGGNDTLNGGGGRDTLVGGGGQDVLRGGGGADVLRGGGGADTFILEAKAGVDRIVDFNLQQDRLGFSGSLTFNDLTFEDRSGNTLISTGSNRLATLVGIQANQISESLFV